MSLIKLKDMGFIQITGVDSYDFLQSMITNDVNLIKDQAKSSIYSLILRANGRFLYDFFLHNIGGNELLLECHKAWVESVMEYLSLYKLRSQVDLENVSDDYYCVANMDNKSCDQGIYTYIDPRTSLIGARTIIKTKTTMDDVIGLNEHEYHYTRMDLGVIEGYYDLIQDKSIPMECCMEQLNAISFDKGCYIGQELTTRTKRHGMVRKQILPFRINSKFIDEYKGRNIVIDNTKVGMICSGLDDLVFGKVKLEHLKDNGMDLDGTNIALSLHQPFWYD